MTKTEQQRIEDLDRENTKLFGKVESLQAENRELREEVMHYRTAVSAVKWLWDQAGKQTPFQL